jgi:hypothetical protein
MTPRPETTKVEVCIAAAPLSPGQLQAWKALWRKLLEPNTSDPTLEDQSEVGPEVMVPGGAPTEITGNDNISHPRT